MKKQFLFGMLMMMFVCVQIVCGQAKYVFYFIGDGMGINQVNIAEVYLSAMNGERGSASLLMTGFPVASMAATFSADADVTDSAAAGTALATGKKTKNGYHKQEFKKTKNRMKDVWSCVNNITNKRVRDGNGAKKTVNNN